MLLRDWQPYSTNIRHITIVPKALKWDEIKLPETWELNEETISSIPQLLEVESIIEKGDETLEIKFANQNIFIRSRSSISEEYKPSPSLNENARTPRLVFPIFVEEPIYDPTMSKLIKWAI